MLLQKELSGFVLVDVQEKLTSHVIDSDNLVSRCSWLIRLAQTLEIPVLVSEQYPSGLGRTIEPLRTLVKAYEPIEKNHFSCFRDATFRQQLNKLGKNQIILAGIETHVCVLQTAIEIKRSTPHDVFVVVDAVSSRSAIDHRYGLKRMKQAGIELVTSEMVFFEWVGCAGTPEFKGLSQSFLMK